MDIEHRSINDRLQRDYEFLGLRFINLLTLVQTVSFLSNKSAYLVVQDFKKMKLWELVTVYAYECDNGYEIIKKNDQFKKNLMDFLNTYDVNSIASMLDFDFVQKFGFYDIDCYFEPYQLIEIDYFSNIDIDWTDKEKIIGIDGIKSELVYILWGDMIYERRKENNSRRLYHYLIQNGFTVDFIDEQLSIDKAINYDNENKDKIQSTAYNEHLTNQLDQANATIAELEQQLLEAKQDTPTTAIDEVTKIILNYDEVQAVKDIYSKFWISDKEKNRLQHTVIQWIITEYPSINESMAKFLDKIVRQKHTKK